MPRKRVSYDEVYDCLNKFVDGTLAETGGYGYAAGFLQMRLQACIMDLPLVRQKEILQVIRSATPDQTKKSVDNSV